MRHSVWVLRALGAALIGLGAAPATAQSDAQIRQQIIRESLASYPGQCPCPYSVMRNGRSCGARSAYSRPGGYAPNCYPRDVSEAEVRARRGH
jgi:choline dehydrogenase-like flavoprotein